jgi:mannose/cellobiose epimerase-like protein (N-acyl-D-glucosamine 2-epimerase family)
MLADNYAPLDAPRCFVKQHEIDQLHIFASWYEKRQEGLYYSLLPERRLIDGEALRWAQLILDGDAVV